MTFEEQNALRYVAGYVVRKVYERLEYSLPNKKNMLDCLEEINGEEANADKGTEEWTNMINRGGLWNVNDLLYSLFVAFEEVIRQHLTIETIKKQLPGAKAELIHNINSNENVTFQWQALSLVYNMTLAGRYVDTGIGL